MFLASAIHHFGAELVKRDGLGASNADFPLMMKAWEFLIADEGFICSKIRGTLQSNY